MKIGILGLAILGLVLAAAPDYSNQAAWTDPSCQTGTTQSPINIASATDSTDFDIYYDGSNWENVSLDASVTYLWQWNSAVASRSSVRYRLRTAPTTAGECQEAKYTAVQLHFHRTSEHTVGGTSYTSEMHIVHQRDHEYASCSNMKAYLVVGVFFNEDANASDNAFLRDLSVTNTASAGNANIKDHISTWMSNGVYNYKGSLTTPACSEVVEWIVCKNVQTMSPAQKTAFDSMGSGISNRNVQSNASTLYSISGDYVHNEGGDGDGRLWMYVVFPILAVIIIVVVIVVIICCAKKKQKCCFKGRDVRTRVSSKDDLSANDRGV